MKALFLFICCLFFLTACEKDELPVPKHNSEDVTTSAVDMGASYQWQIYFDLKTNSVVGKNPKTSWDLGFETSPEGNHIILNASKSMYAWDTGISGFDAVTDTNGFAAGKKWDAPSGNFDSTAVGNWQDAATVYIIDRGYNESGVHQGFRKIRFLNADAEKYTVLFSSLNGSDETTLEIQKDSFYNFTFLSFTTNDVVSVEPPKASWDLVFTQYIHIFYEPDLTPYLVTGCLTNRYQTTSAADTNSAFPAIDYNAALSYPLSSSINVIGYGWKEFSGTVYTVNPGLNYIIRDREGYFYKLHFTGFYNSFGVKGNPQWEYQQL